MRLDLDGLHILVTGGSKGIGLACARSFLEEGARVSLVARSEPDLQHAAATLGEAMPDASQNVRTYAADLRDAGSALGVLDRVEEAGGPVDVLVNSAGAARRTPPADLDPSAWHDAMQAKFFTYIHIMDPLIKRMGQRGRGAIVNVIGAGGKVASPIHLPGGAANAALMLATAGLAAAYAQQGVRVNAVNPGLTATERLKEGLAADAKLHRITPEEALRRANERLPLGRIADPVEIANAVLFLASPRASYVTGAILSLDGALTPLI